jgi:hypothetical protein
MPTTTVLYTEQTLTNEQKAQARENIGALSADIIVTPQMYGVKGDGVTDDTNPFKSMLSELNSGETVNLMGETYILSGGLTLSDVYITNGTIVYTGPASERILTLNRNSGLTNVNVDIRTVNYASDVVYVDYSNEPEQWVSGQYIIDGLHINNTTETSTFVENSTCVRIRYKSYQVIWGQTINNLTFDGMMD